MTSELCHARIVTVVIEGHGDGVVRRECPRAGAGQGSHRRQV